MKKIVAITVWAIVVLAFVSASYGFSMYGKSRTLTYEEDGKILGYSIKAMGGGLVFGLSERISGFGFEGLVGVSYASPRWSTLNGEDFHGESWFSRASVYDYEARLAYTWEWRIKEFGIGADVHVSWDSVAFQHGSVQEWERLSFHTLGWGWNVGISHTFASGKADGMRLGLSLGQNYGIRSFTAARSRSHWNTSRAETEPIDASVGELRASLSVTVDL